MIKTGQMIFQIDGSTIPPEKVLDWEYKKLVANYKMFKKIKGVSFNSDFDKWVEKKDIASMSADLLKSKTTLSLDRLRSELKPKYQIANFSSVIGAKISRGKRKYSITEIYVPKSDLSLEEVLEKITNIMMTNNQEHLNINLNSNPDLYVLQSVSDTVQEVVEITGGSPLPTRFFAHYGDEG